MYSDLGRALVYYNRAPEAAAAFEHALEEEGSQPSAYDILLQLGAGYERGGNGEAAVRAYLRAAANEPGQTEDALSRAARPVTRDIARAVRAWAEGEWFPGMQRAELTARQRVQVALFLGKLSVTAEDQGRALEWLARAGALAGGDGALADEAGAALYEAGNAFLNRNEIPSAVEAFRRANELRPSDMPGYWSLVDALRIKSPRPEPPYVSEEDLRESLKVWEKGVALRRPDKDDSWGYLARATVNQQLALIPGADRWALGWEALCYCERAFALSPEDASRRAYLARWYRFLGLAACEYQATAEGLKQDEEDPTALEERIICLTNAGRYDEVEPLLVKRREIDKSTWTDAVEAFVKVRQGAPEAALRLIEKAIQNFPNLIWCREVRAECYRQLGRPTDAEQDYGWILKRYHPDDVENQSNYGLAAFRLGLREGKVDRAFEILSRIFEGRLSPLDAETRIYLGLCRLVRGDVKGGRELLSSGIKLCGDRRLLGDLLNIELVCVETAAKGWPNGDEVCGVLNRDEDGVKAQLRAQLKEAVEHPPSGAEELRNMLETGPEGDADGWLRVAAQAGLARMHAAAGEWTEAGDIYRQLLEKEKIRFPEARDALIALSDSAVAAGAESFEAGRFEEGADHLSRALRIECDLGRFDRQAGLQQSLGDWLVRAGKPSEALERYAQGLEAARQPDGGGEALQGDAHARIGYVQLRLGNRAEAKSHFCAAFHLYRTSNPSNPGEQLAGCLRSLIPDFAQFWELDDALKACADEPGFYCTLRTGEASFLNTLALLQTPAAPAPGVTPVVLELSDALVPLVDPDQDGGKFLNELIPAMRERIKAETGASVPGVRARPNSALPEGAYEVQIDETPVNRGAAVRDRWYFAGSPMAPAGLDIEGHSSPAAHPVTGEPGCWLDAQGLAVLKAAGKTAWSAPEFLIAIIEAVLRRNVTRFVGLQETAGMLSEWEKLPGGKEQVQAALPTPLARRRFTWMVQGLLAERAPIVEWREILAAAKDLDAATAPIQALVRAARLRLRGGLPGNAPGAPRVALPAGFEDRLLGSEDGRAFLAADPIQKLDFLAWLRGEMEHRDPQTVLVTRSPALRPLLRRLVAPEFPDLMALAEEEVLDLDDPAAASQAHSASEEQKAYG
jgi:tetratricopeptide (TPR) repeat protein